jgi:hypothetical protein
MKVFFNSIFISLLLVTSSLIHAAPLSLDRVSAFIKETNTNSDALNTDYFKEVLAPNMQFHVIIYTKANTPTIKGTIIKKDYLDLLAETKKLITNFKLTILSRDITIKDDFAIIDSRQVESLTINGDSFSLKNQ